jgi:hypothetical protein
MVNRFLNIPNTKCRSVKMSIVDRNKKKINVGFNPDRDPDQGEPVRWIRIRKRTYLCCVAQAIMSEWQGITIRDLLERVDLLNFINPDEVSQNKAGISTHFYTLLYTLFSIVPVMDSLLMFLSFI